MRENRDLISITSRGRLDLLSKSDIVYVQSQKRKVFIYTLEGTFTCYQTLNDFEQKLSDPRFLRIHQSYLVNTGYVRQLTGGEKLRMLNNEILPISRKYRRTVRLCLMHLGIKFR